jgi:glutaredoxin
VKRSLFSTLFVAAFLLGVSPAFAESSDIHAFVRDGCTHCRDLEEFVEEWGEDAPEVQFYEVTTLEAQDIFKKVQLRMPGLQQAVPLVVIDGQVIQGFDTAETTGERIKEIYEKCSAEENCISFDDFLLGKGSEKATVSSATCTGDPTQPCTVGGDDDRFVFNLWFVGETDLRDFSLPALSLILGGLDGFNPCAMWVLITLLTLLINTRSWAKIWVIGGIFLFVSGAMYYLFIAAWLNVFLLIGFNLWVQKVIGIVAIGGGSFYLYEAFGKNPNECKVTNMNQRQKTIQRMKNMIHAASWPIMIVSVAVLAVSVNLIELVCTAGLPAIFTEILAFNPITNMERYWYMLLYILAYMFDDLIIFIIAIASMRATGLTTKYQRFSFIFGGVLMAILGILLIFYPEALTFG